MKKEKLIVLNTFRLWQFLTALMPLHTPQYSDCIEDLLETTGEHTDMFQDMFHYYFGKEAILDDFSPIQILENVLTSLFKSHDICVDSMYWQSVTEPRSFTTEYACYMKVSDASIQAFEELIENIQVVHNLSNRKEVLSFDYIKEDFSILTYEDFSNIIREKLFRSLLTEEFKIEVLTWWYYDTFQGQLALTFNSKKDFNQILAIIIQVLGTNVVKTYPISSLKDEMAPTYVGILLDLSYFVPLIHNVMSIQDTTNLTCCETAFLSCFSNDIGSRDLFVSSDLKVNCLSELYDTNNSTYYTFEPIRIC